MPSVPIVDRMEKVTIKVERVAGHIVVSDDGDSFDVSYHDTPESVFEDVERRLFSYGAMNCTVVGEAATDTLRLLGYRTH